MQMMKLPPAPIGLGLSEAGTVLGISRTSIYALIKSGRLRSVKIGCRRIVLTDDLKKFAENLIGQEAEDVDAA